MTALARVRSLAGVRLVLVTDRRLMGAGDPDAFARAIDRALSAGVPAGAALVQVREKDLEGRALLAYARAAVSAAHARGALVLVNDRADVAVAAGADGVHLPERGLAIADARALLGTVAIVGVSRHAPVEVAAASGAGADLVMLGPIYATPSKAAYGAPLGVDAVRAAVVATATATASPSAAIIAIGGVDTPDRARACLDAGAHAVAVIRAVWTAPDPGAAAAGLCLPVGAPDPLANPPPLR